MIPRTLTWVQQHSIHQAERWHVRPDGSLDVPKLMAAWQVFWPKDEHLAAEGFHYCEAGPHLMLMAFLLREPAKRAAHGLAVFQSNATATASASGDPPSPPPRKSHPKSGATAVTLPPKASSPAASPSVVDPWARPTKSPH